MHRQDGNIRVHNELTFHNCGESDAFCMVGGGTSQLSILNDLPPAVLNERSRTIGLAPELRVWPDWRRYFVQGILTQHHLAPV